MEGSKFLSRGVLWSDLYFRNLRVTTVGDWLEWGMWGSPWANSCDSWTGAGHVVDILFFRHLVESQPASKCRFNVIFPYPGYVPERWELCGAWQAAVHWVPATSRPWPPPAPSCLQTLRLFLPHPQPFTTLSPSPPSLPASFSSSLSFLFLFFFFKTKFIVLIIKTTERHYRESGNQRNKDEKPDQLQPPPPALPASLWAWFPAACFFWRRFLFLPPCNHSVRTVLGPASSHLLCGHEVWAHLIL